MCYAPALQGSSQGDLRPLDNPGVDGSQLAREVDADLAKLAGVARKRQHIALVVYLGKGGLGALVILELRDKKRSSLCESRRPLDPSPS